MLKEVHYKIQDILGKHGLILPVHGEQQEVFLMKILACLEHLDNLNDRLAEPSKRATKWQGSVP